MDFRGGKSTLYADHGYASRVRHKCNREREKGERKRWTSKFKKEPGKRTGAEREREQDGEVEERRSFEEKAAAGQVEEVHHCWRGEGRMVGMEGQTDDKL